MTIKLTLLIKLLLTTSICYVIEKQFHESPQEKTLHQIQKKLSA
ncbi:hypothetical protein [Candidatus Chromulinivorax destructor]|nr:hypothetical protein [Candidatus Chromulinivorax destructor]